MTEVSLNLGYDLIFLSASDILLLFGTSAEDTDLIFFSSCSACTSIRVVEDDCHLIQIALVNNSQMKMMETTTTVMMMKLTLANR